jgi:hypothetical protein
MKISFPVMGLAPKKDDANSMWRKGSEFSRLKALRIATNQAMQGRSPVHKPIRLSILIFARPKDGDLDTAILIMNKTKKVEYRTNEIF